MERDSASPPLGEFSRTQIEVILDRIFDYGESQSQADLWRGEADAGRIAHCLAHELDEVLYLARAYLFNRQITCTPPQNGVTRLHDLQWNRQRS